MCGMKKVFNMELFIYVIDFMKYESGLCMRQRRGQKGE